MTVLFTCPDCAFESPHPKDAENSYCTRCHEFKVCLLCSAGPVPVIGGMCGSCYAEFGAEPDNRRPSVGEAVE